MMPKIDTEPSRKAGIGLATEPKRMRLPLSSTKARPSVTIMAVIFQFRLARSGRSMKRSMPTPMPNRMGISTMTAAHSGRPK